MVVCFLPSLAPFGQAVSEEKIFLTLANQKKKLILVAMFVGRMEPNELGSKHLCKVLYKDSPFRSVPPTNMAAKGNSCF
jgi:hypothetical protein